MGHYEIITALALVFLATFSNENAFVKGQSPLQVEPWDGVHSILQGNRQSSKVDHVKVDDGKGKTPLDNQTLPWRLPRETLPTQYSVRIAPVLDDGQHDVAEQWFTPGEVNITIDAQIATNQIIFHSKNITIEDIKVSQLTTDIPVHNWTLGQHDFLTINLGAELQPSQRYVVSIKFQSYISEALNGLYRSSYIDPDNNQRVWLATTQMEALHARQVFPCFDEPAIKSIFQFTIGRMTKYISLFNTESTGTTPGPATDWVWESYEPTPVMSTYLLAVIISEFTFEEAPEELFPGKKVRTYAPDHYIREAAGEYAAENVAKVLSKFSTYYNHTYPLPKMDSAAVPDFFFGAMENYGLNIYRETALLVFPGVSLESERWTVSTIIAHELAHQWFGDLVSPAWWTHIWLNEGFATYLEILGVEHTNPEFEPAKRYLNDVVQRSMEYAADPSYAHPVKIDEFEWINKGAMDWFSLMVYEQAGSLIRMMDGFMTTPVFTEALQAYLNELQYKSAQQDDLFRHLNTLTKSFNKIPSHLTVKEIMDTWTLKPGFPLLRISRISSTRVYVSQEKFTNNVGAGKVDANDDDELWHIPISVATESSPNFDPAPERWMDMDTIMEPWEINADEWIILNAGATGYFRVLYDLPLTHLIKAQLQTNHTVIDPLTRSQLLDDYLTEAFQNYISLQQALEMPSYLTSSAETEMVVWNALLKHMRKPLNLMSGAGGDTYDSFKNYLLPKLKRSFTALGGIGAEFAENAGMPILRHQQFADWTCALEDDECQDFSVNSVNEWKDTSTNNIPRDIQQIVYCAAVAKGNDDIFQFIKEQYNDTATTTIQRNRLLNALACTTETRASQELLDGSITSGYFRSPLDGSRLLGRLAMTTSGRSAVLQFLRGNARPIRDFFGSADSIRTIYSTAATYASTSVELENLETIADEIADVISDVKESIEASLATVRSNIDWIRYYAASFNG